MTLPVSERVLGAIVARLRLITMANGYNTDAGTKAFRAKRTFDSVDLPGCSVWDSGEETNEGTSNHSAMLMRQLVTVEAHVASDKADSGVQAGLLKADVKRAVLSGGHLVDDDGGLGEIVYLGATVESAPSGGNTEVTNVNFAILYKETRGDPTDNTGRIRP